MTDEDRCEKHDLIVEQCADCRGLGEVVDPYEGVLIERFYSSAQYNAHCALFPEHKIHLGSPFAFAVYDTKEGPPFEKLGYICNKCTRKITGD